MTIEKAHGRPRLQHRGPLVGAVTFSGDYLHDAYWSVGEQGFTNKMVVPGDPVKITGSPRAGTWDNGWTMWFLPWNRWVRGSALHEAVHAGPHGSTFVSA